MKRIQVIQVNDVGPSLNQYYAGMHYSKRSALKNDWCIQVKSAVIRQKIQPVEEYPVAVACRIVMGKGRRMYDWDNTAVCVKMFQDALVKAKVLKGDQLKYIIGGKIWCVRGTTTATQFIIYEGAEHVNKFGFNPC